MFDIMKHDASTEWAQRLVYAYTSDRRIGRDSVGSPSLRQEVHASLTHTEGEEESNV